MGVGYGILGPLAVVRDGRPVDVGSPKQRAVLAVLVVEANQVVPADRLVDLLWGEAPPPRALGSLQAYVSNLRRVLEPGRPARTQATTIVSRRPGYVLLAEEEALDAARFEALAGSGRRALATGDPPKARGALADALALWRGDALSDLVSVPFLATEAARLEEMRMSALEARIAADLALGESGAIVPEIYALIERDPFRETLRELLMLALYRSGRQAEALGAFRAARDLLVDELGVEPGPRLRDLEARILQHSPDLDWRPPAESSVPKRAPTRPPLGWHRPVGRDRHLERLDRALDAVEDGRGRTVLLAGEPGIGKTLLADEVALRAGARGIRAVWGRCHEGGTAPAFWPWTQVVREVATPQRLEEIAALSLLLPERGTADRGSLPDDPDQARARLYESVTRLLRSFEEPVVVLLDDLQWADIPSLGLLEFVVPHLQRRPVLVLGMYRDLEVGPGHPLGRALGGIVREPHVERIGLRGLTEDEIGELIADRLGRDPGPGVAETIHRRTEGNPFFAVELLELLRSEGALSREAAASAIPASVQDVVLRWMSQLPPETVSLLEMASVIGRELELTLLEEVAGTSPDETLDRIDPALVLGLVTVPDAVARLRFSHDLVREVVRGTLTATRRARLHGEVGWALVRFFGADDLAHASDRAAHFAAAAPVLGPLSTVPHLVGGADAATLGLAHERAIELLELSLNLLGSAPWSSERARLESAVHVRLGILRVRSRGYADPQGMASFDEVRRLAASHPDAVQADDLLRALTGLAASGLVRTDFDAALAAVGELRAAGARRGDDRFLVQGELQAGIAHMQIAELEEAEREFARAMDLAGGPSDPSPADLMIYEPGAVAQGFLAMAQALGGATDAAEVAASARRRAEALDHQFTVAHALLMEGFVAVILEDPPAAAGASTSLIDVCDRYGFMQYRSMARILDCWAARRPGACEVIRDEIDAMHAMGARMLRHFFFGMLAETELAAGRLEEAREALGAAFTEANESGERFYLPRLRRLAVRLSIEDPPVPAGA